MDVGCVWGDVSRGWCDSQLVANWAACLTPQLPSMERPVVSVGFPTLGEDLYTVSIIWRHPQLTTGFSACVA